MLSEDRRQAGQSAVPAIGVDRGITMFNPGSIGRPHEAGAQTIAWWMIRTSMTGQQNAADFFDSIGQKRTPRSMQLNVQGCRDRAAD